MTVRIGLAQINSVVGDISGNVEKIMAFCAEASKLAVDVVVFPEMAVCGYPPEDLLLKKHFLNDNRAAIDALAGDCPDVAIIVGFAEAADDGYFNSLAILEKASIKTIYRKIILPNYGVFDERRYFRPGRRSTTATLHGHVVVPTICEDIWHVEWIDKFIGEIYRRDLIVNISASPFHVGKLGERKEILRRCATHFNCPVAYCNLVGGQDELVFDGRSMFADAQGVILCQAKAFEEDLLVADVDPAGGKIRPINADSALIKPATRTDRVGEVYRALVLGTRDYVRKNGFSKVVIGMSGGIDSALTAVIAADALGPQNVAGVTMPTKFNSAGTIRDAGKVAENLGIKFHTIPIGTVLDQFAGVLKPVASSSQTGIAYENLQARIRGTILMY
ncbi:MAG: NAD(+) synthase, partial [Planctomycetota bacterium]